MKKAIYLILVLLTLTGIFLLSNQSSKDSNKISKYIVNKGVVLYTEVTKKQIDNKMIDRLNYYVRKVAHFTEYFILGIFIYLLFNSFDSSNRLLYSLILCFIFALIDELHQKLTGYRDPRMMDVLIDTIGSATAFLVLIINKNRKLAR